jgi:hypothetical protein
VDREGFDVVLDDGDRQRRIQLKVVDGGTTSWNVPKRLLRPGYPLGVALGFRDDIEGEGVDGALVVTQYDPDAPELSVRYLMADAHTIKVLAEGWMPKARQLKGREAGSQKTAGDFLDRLGTGVGSELIGVPKGLLVEAKGPSELLALLGMHSTADHQWASMLHKRLGKEFSTVAFGPLHEKIGEEFERLVVF